MGQGAYMPGSPCAWGPIGQGAYRPGGYGKEGPLGQGAYEPGGPMGQGRLWARLAYVPVGPRPYPSESDDLTGLL